MLTNYLKTTFRSLKKNKVYSGLNIFGLTIGIVCSGLIFLWVEDEVRFDSNHLKKDRVFAVRENQNYDKGVFTHWSTPGLLGPAIQKEIPGIANTCRMSEGNNSVLFSVGDKAVYAAGRNAEASVFDMLTLPFVQGNPKTAFAQLYSIVITEKTAKKFFGNEKDVIGKKLRADNKQDFIVTGVIKDQPENSSMQFEWLTPFEILFDQSPWMHKWTNNSILTLVELGATTSVESVNNQLKNYLKQKDPATITQLFLFGLKDWRLYDQFENGKQTGSGRIAYVRLFAIIAWIILLIACINFMNLSTARSEKRAKEVGVRKVLGAEKKWLIGQFISESIIMSLLAAVFALLIIVMVLPAFNTLVQKNLSADLGNPVHLSALVAITLVCGLVAGSYPALYLSSFNPVSVLKGLKSTSTSVTFIRKGLVVLQFTVSIVLIISTIVIYQQIQHVKNRNLGFNKDNLVEMKVTGDMGSHFDLIKQDLLETGVVENVALSDHTTIGGGNNTSGFTWDGKTEKAKVLISTRNVTPEFMETSGIELLEGRNLQASDTNRKYITLVITESLKQLMGKGSPIGKTIHYEGDTVMGHIVGVVKDYVYGNMYNKPDPVVFLSIPPRYASVMYIRTKASVNAEQSLAQIARVMKKDNPSYPFDYKFVDDQFNQMFLTEMLVSKLSRVFAALAIIISCLGLFGLAIYTAERRTKEIGVRKVLGASVPQIVGLLSKDFLQLVLISTLIAFPIAWWAMNAWLQTYAYRISPAWWVFIAAGFIAMLIALLTISFQSIKAAIANPVKSLRTE